MRTFKNVFKKNIVQIPCGGRTLDVIGGYGLTNDVTSEYGLTLTSFHNLIFTHAITA